MMTRPAHRREQDAAEQEDLVREQGSAEQDALKNLERGQNFEREQNSERENNLPKPGQDFPKHEQNSCGKGTGDNSC